MSELSARVRTGRMKSFRSTCQAMLTNPHVRAENKRKFAYWRARCLKQHMLILSYYVLELFPTSFTGLHSLNVQRLMASGNCNWY